jgi:hypothetical protein
MISARNAIAIRVRAGMLTGCRLLPSLCCIVLVVVEAAPDDCVYLAEEEDGSSLKGEGEGGQEEAGQLGEWAGLSAV